MDKVLMSPVLLLPMSWYELLKTRRENLADVVGMVPSFLGSSNFQKVSWGNYKGVCGCLQCSHTAFSDVAI